jgi:hypothetical protein
MNTSTYFGRVQLAMQLRAALHRMPGNVLPAPGPADGATPGPIGNCGRGLDEECGLKNPEECQVHADVPDGDPETLGFAGTLQQRCEQLRATRRYGLQRQAR